MMEALYIIVTFRRRQGNNPAVYPLCDVHVQGNAFMPMRLLESTLDFVVGRVVNLAGGLALQTCQRS